LRPEKLAFSWEKARREAISKTSFPLRFQTERDHSVRRSLVHLLGGAATYMVLGADLSAMWETFHGDNRKRTATNADSDDLARVYRFDLAQDSEMISPTVAI
jgi:hypothetical protein